MEECCGKGNWMGWRESGVLNVLDSAWTHGQAS